MTGRMITEARGRMRDTAFAASYRMERLRHRAETLYGRASQAWQTASPGSFRSAQRLVRQIPPEPAAPLPPMGSTVEIDGITMRVDPRMSEHNIRKLMSGRHTRHERDLLGGSLRNGDRLLELGGGIGMVAIHSALRLGSDSVFSIEANPDLESLIRDNYALNGVFPTLQMCMVGPAPGSHVFHQAAKFSRSSGHVAGPDTVEITVPVRALNDELGRIRPTVMVVDIQGGEVELFGYADLSGLRLLLVEIHPDLIGIDAANRLRRRIRAAGFIDAGQAGQSFLFARSEPIR